MGERQVHNDSTNISGNRQTNVTVDVSDMIEPHEGRSGLSGSSSAGSPAPSVDLGKVRELIIQANPGVVPELIAGDSFDAMLASVEPAKAAYQRIIANVQTQPPSAPQAGAAAPSRQFVINVEELSPSAKIREGLRRRSQS